MISLLPKYLLFRNHLLFEFHYSNGHSIVTYNRKRFILNTCELQKRAARMILKADFMTPSEQLFKELNWLPFPKRVQYHTCLMVYKSITGQAPEYISSMLTYVSEHHERQTRSTVLDLLHIPRSHSAYFDRAFLVQGQKLWNSLPADIRNSISINRFKRELKRYLLYNN